MVAKIGFRKASAKVAEKVVVPEATSKDAPVAISKAKTTEAAPKAKKAVSVWAKDQDEKKDVKTSAGASFTETDVQKVQGMKDQARLALIALRKHFSDRGGKSLFPDIDHALHLAVVYKKPTMISQQQKARIILPHFHRTISNTSVCIIMPDLDQSEKAKVDPDVEKQARKWADEIEKDHRLTSKHYSKLLTKRQLEREFHSYAERRALATQYDLFLVDARVAKAVTSFLGKEFHKAYKMPLWFNYTDPLATTIEKSLKTVTFPLHKYLTRASISVGHMGQETADLAGNMDAVVDGLLAVCPGGLVNVRSIFLQPATSKPSLPIYRDDGSTGEVKMVKDRTRDHRDRHTVEDELSTLPDGLKVQVRRDGHLRVLKEEDNEEIIYPTIHDEWDDNDIEKPSADLVKVALKRASNKRMREVRKTARAGKKAKKEWMDVF